MKIYQSHDHSKPIREIVAPNEDPTGSMLVRYENELEIIANNEVKSYIDHMEKIGMIDIDLANVIRKNHPHLFS
jgi:hypothetical protein